MPRAMWEPARDQNRYCSTYNGIVRHDEIFAVCSLRKYKVLSIGARIYICIFVLYSSLLQYIPGKRHEYSFV